MTDMDNDNDNDERLPWDDGLKPRQRNFVVFYCTDEDCFMNGRASYRKAHTKYKAGEVVYTPSDEVCDVGASKLLSIAKVKQACRRLLAEMQPDVDAENIPRLLHDLVLQAMYNPADIVDERGNLVVNTLDELGDKAKCIKQIWRNSFGTRVELTDRTKAQEKLLRYYALVRNVPDVADTMQRLQLVKQADSIAEWNVENAS